MKQAIIQTKLLIDNYFDNKTNQHEHYRKFYLFTNEEIDSYLSILNAEPSQKALSVLASGDHAFNLISKGIKNVDTFDINQLTEYYVFGIKKALITKCNYQEFLQNFMILTQPFSKANEEIEIIRKLLPYMEEKYKIYWSEILSYYSGKAKEMKSNFFTPHSLLYVLEAERPALNLSCHYNNYLHGEYNYNLFKSNLSESNITFKHSDITDLPENFKGKYDYILLSNILDYIYKNWNKYWTIDKLNKFIDSLKTIMSENSLLFLHYCYDEKDPINYTGIKLSNFKEDEILSFDGAFSTNSQYLEHMILKRINTKL